MKATKIIIAGAGEVGSHLAKMFCDEGNTVTVVDESAERLALLNSTVDILPFEGDEASIKVLKDAGAANADLLVAVLPYTAQEKNLTVTMLAKQLGTAKVAARIKNEEYLSEEGTRFLKNCGIDYVFFPEKIAAEEIISTLKHNASTEMMEIAQGKMQIGVFKLNEDSPVLDMKLLEAVDTLAPHLKSEFRIISISRERHTIIPGPETKFRFGDVIYLMAKNEAMPEICKYFGKKDSEVKNIILMGAGTMGEMVAREICAGKMNLKIIERDRERCLQLTESLPDSVKIINADGSNSDILFDEGIGITDAFIALSGNDEANILACVAAKKFGVGRTIAGVENLEYARLAEELGVDNIINKKYLCAGRIFKLTLSDRARFVKCMTGTNSEIIEYTVSGDSHITGKPLKDIKFPEGAIIGGVTRGSDAFLAVGNTVLTAGDRVIIFAVPDAIKEIERLFR